MSTGALSPSPVRDLLRGLRDTRQRALSAPVNHQRGLVSERIDQGTLFACPQGNDQRNALCVYAREPLLQTETRGVCSSVRPALGRTAPV